MKLKLTADIPAFLRYIQSCKGEVRFVTSEGDNLNLKSILSQIIFAAVISGSTWYLDGNVALENTDDYGRLEKYFDI